MLNETVLVTGGTGFLGARVVAQLLQAGYRVRTTVRSLDREPDVRAAVEAAGAQAGDALEVVVADLTEDAGWSEAVAGCVYVQHVASPFPGAEPEHDDDLIVPAREGTLRVLRAARQAGVRRVVLTSSFAAIGYGHPATERAYTEADWTDPYAEIGAYVKSKTLAERAAWDFVAREGGGMELTVVNPVGIFGPVLGPDHSASIQMVQGLLEGRMRAGAPRLWFAVVDVRDVADLQLRAMTDPAAAGERFLGAAGDSISMHDIATILREHLGDAARLVPADVLPDEAVRAAAADNPAMGSMLRELGNIRHLTNEKARRVLGWAPRSSEETVLATAESLLQLGLLTGPDRKIPEG